MCAYFSNFCKPLVEQTYDYFMTIKSSKESLWNIEEGMYKCNKCYNKMKWRTGSQLGLDQVTGHAVIMQLGFWIWGSTWIKEGPQTFYSIVSSFEISYILFKFVSWRLSSIIFLI